MVQDLSKFCILVKCDRGAFRNCYPLMGRCHLSKGFLYSLNAYFVLEVAWLVFWFVAIIWLHSTQETTLGFSYRSDMTNAFVHFSALMMFIYATDSAHPTPDPLVLIILLGIVLYDVQMVVTTYEHASRVAIPEAWRLQQAVILFGLISSSFGTLWYAVYWLTSKKSKSITCNKSSAYYVMK